MLEDVNVEAAKEMIITFKSIVFICMYIIITL